MQVWQLLLCIAHPPPGHVHVFTVKNQSMQWWLTDYLKRRKGRKEWLHGSSSCPLTSQRGRRVQAFGLVFLDGLEEVGVRVEQLPLVLPVVAGRDEQAAVLGKHRLHPP